MLKARLKSRAKKLIKALPHQAKVISAFAAAIIITATFPTQFVKAVEIYDGDEGCRKIYTFSNDTESILDSANIEVDEADDVIVRGASHATDMTIRIKRAFNVYVKSAGKTAQLSMTEGTVKDALGKAGYITDEYDTVNFPLEKELFDGITVEYTNIDYTTETEVVTVPHKTVTKRSFDMKEGEKKVLKAGKDGKKSVTTVKKLVNGNVTEEITTEEVLEKAVTEKVKVGAKSVAASSKNWVSELKCDKKIMLDKSGVPTKYSKKLTGVASAYCTGTICSTGVRVKPGYIAVDPTIIPYGTEMYIRTPDGGYIYGYAVAADTGGFTAWGNTIADLYVSSYSEAINFGRRNIEIYII